MTTRIIQLKNLQPRKEIRTRLQKPINRKTNLAIHSMSMAQAGIIGLMQTNFVKETGGKSEMSFIRKRIKAILDLKNERHFIPGFILGFYAITMLSTLMTYWTFLFFGKIENPCGALGAPSNQLINCIQVKLSRALENRDPIIVPGAESN